MRKRIATMLILVLSLSLFSVFGLPVQAEATDYPLTIVDSSEREVRFEEEPKTVVSLAPSLTEILFALGLGDRILGRTTYCDYPEEVAEIPEIGDLRNPNVELIIEQNPDLVLAAGIVPEETLESLTALGIKVVNVYAEEDLDNVKDVITTIATIFNVQSEANRLVSTFTEKLEYFREKTAEVKRPTVYYLLGFGEYGEFTAGGDTFIHDILEAAGGDNIAKDVMGWNYSLEQLIEQDPDVILIPAWAEETFGKEAPYSELTAVKEDRVFTIDVNKVERQGPRCVEGVAELNELFTKAAIDLYTENTVYPIRVTDSEGNELEFTEAPKKVISLGPNMTELIFTLNLSDTLVGRTIYCNYPEEVLEIKEVGTLMEPNFELIAELEPDLVLASTHVSEATMEKLRELDIPVLMLYEEEELEGMVKIITLLGEVFDINKAALHLSDDFMRRIDRVRLERPVEKPRIYYVVGFGEYGEFTAGKETFIHDIIVAAGGENIAADVEGWSYSLEELIEQDPDMILLPDWAEEDFVATAPYSELKAVKEGHVYAIDENIFVRQGPRNSEAVEVLAEIIQEFLEAQAEADESAVSPKKAA